MARARKSVKRPPTGLTRWVVGGFKSHFTPTDLRLASLTILCGANSSGKTSVMQPLLLMKQTLDALPLDAGALKLDGPNVSFTDPAQFRSASSGHPYPLRFELELSRGSGVLGVSLSFSLKRAAREPYDVIDLDACTYRWDSLAEVRLSGGPKSERYGCFLVPSGRDEAVDTLFELSGLIDHLRRLIHLSGHRGHPERQYPREVVRADRQPGLFHTRAASTLASWQTTDGGDPKRDSLSQWLRALGLTWKAEAIARDATSLEILVARIAKPVRGSSRNLVSVADVGFGVSQSLPVLIGLIEAEPGQLVYVEQPEIHLHPRAQKGMADLIAARVRDGVQVIVETHSDILLTRLQHAVAIGTLRPDQVIAHWFQRDPKTGQSTVTSQTPDEAGALGEWPVDFADVASEVDAEYADAAYEHLPVEDDA